MQNMTITHPICHVARFIGDLLSFASSYIVFYTQNGNLTELVFFFFKIAASDNEDRKPNSEKITSKLFY